MTRIATQSTKGLTHSISLTRDDTKSIREVDNDGIEKDVPLIDEISIVNDDKRPLTFIVEYEGVEKINVTVPGGERLTKTLTAREQYYDGENVTTHMTYGS